MFFSMGVLYLIRRGGSSRNRDFFHGNVPHANQLAEVREEGSKLRRIALNKLVTRVGIVESVGFHGITKERGEELSIGHLFHASIIHSVVGCCKHIPSFIVVLSVCGFNT